MFSIFIVTELKWLLWVFIIFEIYLTAKRLHDCNFSGWLSLILLIGQIGFLTVLFMCLYPGTKGENKFGADPR
jgi:uncharacterized membrane protein YhaH (DUF805 family)